MIETGRYTAAHHSEVVVFVIGMRINRLLAVGKWWPVFMAMQRMLGELFADPDSGFLGGETMFKNPRAPLLIQYWRSFDHLHAYAHDPAREHQPAWRAFNKAVGGDGTVGIFHETYVVPAGGVETIYVNMPPFGLGRATERAPATGNRREAKDRLAAQAASGTEARSVSAIQPPPSTRSPA